MKLISTLAVALVMALCAAGSAKAQISNFNGFYAGVLAQQYTYYGVHYGGAVLAGFRADAAPGFVVGAEAVGRLQVFNFTNPFIEAQGRLTAGFTPSDDWLVFGFAGATYRPAFFRGAPEFMTSFGAGVETKIADQISLRGEFDYSHEFRGPALPRYMNVSTARISTGLIFQLN